MLRLALVGLGTIAPFFARAIERVEGVELVAVCDTSPSALADWAVPGFGDVDELIEAGGFEGAVVTAPNDVHAPVCRRLLGAGVAVCCEKPLATSSADARELVEQARSTGTTLLTAFHRRYNANLLELRDRLASRGGVKRIRGRYAERIEEHVGSDPWYLDAARAGGGVLIDNGPNAIDAVRLLAGELEVVDATLDELRNGVEFYAHVRLEAAGGIPVDLELDWALPRGESKYVHVELLDGTVLTADFLAGYPRFKQSLEHEYDAIVRAFAAAVERGDEFGEDGAAVVELVERAYAIARAKEGYDLPRTGSGAGS